MFFVSMEKWTNIKVLGEAVRDLPKEDQRMVGRILGGLEPHKELYALAVHTAEDCRLKPLACGGFEYWDRWRSAKITKAEALGMSSKLLKKHGR